MTKISIGDVIYDPINNEIGLVRACSTGPDIQPEIFYAVTEDQVHGQYCLKTAAWLAFAYWNKLDHLAV